MHRYALLKAIRLQAEKHRSALRTQSWMQAENHRCALPDGPRDDAIGTDVCRGKGAVLEDLVPFRKQAEEHSLFPFFSHPVRPKCGSGVLLWLDKVRDTSVSPTGTAAVRQRPHHVVCGKLIGTSAK